MALPGPKLCTRAGCHYEYKHVHCNRCDSLVTGRTLNRVLPVMQLYTTRCAAKHLQLRDLYIDKSELHFFAAHLVVNIKGDGPAAWYFWCSLKPEEDAPPPTSSNSRNTYP
jgi:hypothetical protein